jgi:imidazolonepropionase-like amidohydrolase
MKKNIILCFSMVLILMTTVSAQIAEKATFGKFALTGGTIHTVSGEVIESGIVLINGNNIEFVGTNVRITNDYTQIDVTGKHVYPGLIDAGSSLGLVEISAVPVTVDNAEIGDYNPHMRAFTAINPNSAAIPVTRVEGVTTVISSPSSGVISGKSTLIDLYGYSPDSMAVMQDVALALNWPSIGRRGFWDQRDDATIEEEYKKTLGTINEFWTSAIFYNKMMDEYEGNSTHKQRPTIDASMEAMRPVVNGKIPVIVQVDREKDILAVLEWIKTRSESRFVLSSVAEGWRVAEQIAESGIAALVGPLLRTPAREHENYQRPYQNAAILHHAGVKVAIRTGSTENVRNLPFNAGYAATYGLGKEEALRAITLNTAEIFGVSDKIGSIDVGKLANIVVTDGDILEAMTKVEHVFIKGFKISMSSRQTLLHDEFLNRDVN